MRSYRELLLAALTAAGVFCLGAALVGEPERTVCAGNLRQLYRMAGSYSADNSGMIVPVYTVSDGGKWNFWPGKLAPYGNDLRMLYCPADTNGGIKELSAANDLLPMMLVPANVSYGLNSMIASSKNRPATAKSPYRLDKVADPAHVVYFGDAVILQLRPTRGCWLRDWNPVHAGQGANYLMADGHVEFFTGNNPGTYDRIAGWQQDKKRWRNWK